MLYLQGWYFIKRGRCYGAVFALCLVLLFSGTAVAAVGTAELPDVFAREDTHIAAGQSVGRLLVTGADAVVAGKVTDGIVVVDGNLVIQPGAVVRGIVLIIGGHSDIAAGAKLEEPVIVIPPRGFPMASIVVSSLIILGTVSLAILPFAAWLAARLFKRTSLYEKVKMQFFALQQRWPALYVVSTLAVSAFMLTLFAEMAWETVFRKTMVVFDNVIIWLVRYFANPDVDRIMIFITDLGYSLPYAVLVAVAFVVLACLKRWREAAGLAVCLAGGAFLNFVLKHLFERSRPDLFRVTEAAGYSFPSGHAMVSLCFYGMLAFLIARNIKSWYGRLGVISVASLLIAAIGVSRIYLGVHYPTDVVAGYAAGSMWLAFCISLLMWWERERKAVTLNGK